MILTTVSMKKDTLVQCFVCIFDPLVNISEHLVRAWREGVEEAGVERCQTLAEVRREGGGGAGGGAAAAQECRQQRQCAAGRRAGAAASPRRAGAASSPRRAGLAQAGLICPIFTFLNKIAQPNHTSLGKPYFPNIYQLLLEFPLKLLHERGFV